MKKFIFLSLIAVMVAGTVFAQDSGISFGAWGRGVFSPLIVESAPKANGKIVKDENGDDLKAEVRAGSGVTWGSNMANVGFTIKGDADFVGFRIDFAGETMGTGDQQMLWVKPFSNDLLKLSVGNIFDDTLRGKLAADTGFEAFVLGGLGEDDIFKRFGAGSTYGDAPHQFMLSSAPIEGLFIGLMVRGDIWSSKAAHAYRYMHLGAGYEIDGIGHIRAQYRGGWLGSVDPANKDTARYWTNVKDFEDGFEDMTLADIAGQIKLKDIMALMSEDDDDDFDPTSMLGGLLSDGSNKRAKIEFAFALTAVENLLVDLGFRIGLPLEVKTGDVGVKYWDGIHIGVGARYNMDAFGVTGEIVVSGMGAYKRNASTGVTDNSVKGTDLQVNLIPTYDLDIATVGLSLGMRLGNIGEKDGEGKKAWKGREAKDADDKVFSNTTLQFGFGGFVRKDLGSGNVRLGLAYTTPPLSPAFNDEGKYDGKKANGSGVFSIPVILEYSF